MLTASVSSTIPKFRRSINSTHVANQSWVLLETDETEAGVIVAAPISEGVKPSVHRVTMNASPARIAAWAPAFFERHGQEGGDEREQY